MSKRWSSLILMTVGLMLVSSCAHQGSLIPRPPSVKFIQFDSLQITPAVVKFKTKLKLINHMPVPLLPADINYAVDLNGTELFRDTFQGAQKIGSRGHQIVTVPFQIKLADLIESVTEIAEEQTVRITFRGEVKLGNTLGLGSIPFSMTKTMPIPRFPSVRILRTQGVPLVDRHFKVVLGVKNNNAFAINIQSIKTYVELNGKKYDLISSSSLTNIDGQTETPVELVMTSSVMKGLGMAFNIISNQQADFNIGGHLDLHTPYGNIYLPVSSKK